MVIDPSGGGGGGVAVVADQMAGRGVQDDGQGIGVQFVGDLVHGGASHETGEGAAVAHGIDFLTGEILQQNVLQTYLAADGIAVGLVVTVDDDAVVIFDGF